MAVNANEETVLTSGIPDNVTEDEIESHVYVSHDGNGVDGTDIPVRGPSLVTVNVIISVYGCDNVAFGNVIRY